LALAATIGVLDDPPPEHATSVAKPSSSAASARRASDRPLSGMRRISPGVFPRSRAA
jgi:hypothetical protein